LYFLLDSQFTFTRNFKFPKLRNHSCKFRQIHHRKFWSNFVFLDYQISERLLNTTDHVKIVRARSWEIFAMEKWRLISEIFGYFNRQSTQSFITGFNTFAWKNFIHSKRRDLEFKTKSEKTLLNLLSKRKLRRDDISIHAWLKWKIIVAKHPNSPFADHKQKSSGCVYCVLFILNSLQFRAIKLSEKIEFIAAPLYRWEFIRIIS
jgi:hypothetical protein